MLRNIMSAVLNRSMLNTPKTVLRISDNSPNFPIFCRAFKEEKFLDKERRPRVDDGVPKETEKLTFITNQGLLENIFPTEKTPEKLYDGVTYKHLPRIMVKATKNNTHMCCQDHKGLVQVCCSAGREGFKHSKKGTAVAAYVTSVTFGRLARKKGVTNARLIVNGFGKGREAVLKGFAQVGINVVSVTDTTPAVYNCPRPKKVRRV